MARTVTRLQLQNRALQLANMEGATILWPLVDIQERINTHLTEEYDLLRLSSPPDYYSSSTTITTVIGTLAYSLPADFIDIQEVLAVESNTCQRPIYPMRRGERVSYRSPTSAVDVVLEYTPTPTSLSSDGSTFDGVNGWDELIVALVARDLLTKASESASAMDQKANELRQRIRTIANRDGAPRLIKDVEGGDSWPFGYNNPITHYRLRAGNLELFESSYPYQ